MTMSGNEWYHEKERVATSVTMKGNEWQRVVTNDATSDSE